MGSSLIFRIERVVMSTLLFISLQCWKHISEVFLSVIVCFPRLSCFSSCSMCLSSSDIHLRMLPLTETFFIYFPDFDCARSLHVKDPKYRYNSCSYYHDGYVLNFFARTQVADPAFICSSHNYAETPSMTRILANTSCGEEIPSLLEIID